MKNNLEGIINEANISLCIKNSSKRVLMQNESCLKLCGDEHDCICLKGCMEILANDTRHQWEKGGTRVYKNSYIHNAYFDVTVICSDHYVITLLQPLEEEQTKALAYYRDAGLSPRELTVISLVITGMSNNDICNRISISNATLRTHLNNVYRKLRQLGKTPEYIPNNRKF